MSQYCVKKQRVRDDFIVENIYGIHTRPATEIVKCLSRFNSYITMTFQGQNVSAKSLLGVLLLAAPRGARVTIQADGDDAEEAVATLLNLAARNFNMTY